MSQLKLFNKKIIISAAADGIGWSIAQECMLNGAIVYLTDKNNKSLDEKYISRDCEKKTGETGHCAMISHETGKQKACYDDCDTARAVTHEAREHPGKTCKEAHEGIPHKKWAESK